MNNLVVYFGLLKLLLIMKLFYLKMDLILGWVFRKQRLDDTLNEEPE